MAKTIVEVIDRDNVEVETRDVIYSGFALEAVVFDTKQNFLDWLNGSFVREDNILPRDLKIGNDVLIREKYTPDYWVSSTSESMTIDNFDEYEIDTGNLATKSEVLNVEQKVESKANKTDIPTTLPNPQKLIIQQGDTTTEYNGSEEKTITIESGGGEFDLQDLPQFTNKIEIDMSKATSLAGLLTLPIVSSTNFYVNWGDGSGTMYTEATTSISHQYSDTNFAGWITIYGDWKGVQFTQSADNNKNIIIRIEYDDNITSIVDNAFITCKNLLSIKIPDSVTTIGTNAFLNTALTKIVLPENLVEIDGAAFYTSDLYDVVIPSKVTTIDLMLFWYCTNLNTVILHDNITNIKSNAFCGCSKLKNIKIPQNVTNIGDDVFKDCSVLTEILIEPNSPPVISTSTFTSVINTYYVKYSSLQQYKQATNWSAYADIIYPKGGNYSETITIPSTAWDSETKTATVEAIGATSEARNLIIPSVQGNNDNNVRCTAQGTMTLTFTCDTVPTEDTVVDVSYILTNKNV